MNILTNELKSFIALYFVKAVIIMCFLEIKIIFFIGICILFVPFLHLHSAQK